MMKRLAAAPCALVVCAAASIPSHGATPADDATRQRIRDVIQRATGMTPESVEPSALMPGYFEIRAKGAIAYVDAKAKFLVRGPVVDLATGEKLTGASGAAPRIDTSELPIRDAVTTVTGKGARTLFVFVDPNCAFCRNLESELAQLGNVTVHRLLIPMAGPGSLAAARSVWCAGDRTAAWRQVTSGGALAPAQAGCDAEALTRNVALARRLGVTATPTLVFAHGDRVAATMNAQALEARIGAPAVSLKP